MRAQRVRTPHRCTACGRRTYRRIRRFPTLGTEDARCTACVHRGFEPRQAQPDQEVEG